MKLGCSLYIIATVKEVVFFACLVPGCFSACVDVLTTTVCLALYAWASTCGDSEHWHRGFRCGVVWEWKCRLGNWSGGYRGNAFRSVYEHCNHQFASQTPAIYFQPYFAEHKTPQTSKKLGYSFWLLVLYFTWVWRKLPSESIYLFLSKCQQLVFIFMSI